MRNVCLIASAALLALTASAQANTDFCPFKGHLDLIARPSVDWTLTIDGRSVPLNMGSGPFGGAQINFVEYDFEFYKVPHGGKPHGPYGARLTITNGKAVTFKGSAVCVPETN